MITTIKLFQLTPICALQASRAEGPRQNQNKRTDREIIRANNMHLKVLLDFSKEVWLEAQKYRQSVALRHLDFPVLRDASLPNVRRHMVLRVDREAPKVVFTRKMVARFREGSARLI